MAFCSISEFKERVGPEGRIMGIDWGRQRLGIAISDELRLLAHPLETLTRSTFQHDVQGIRTHIRTYHIRGLVIGLPYGVEASKSVISIRSWAHRLASCIPLPLTLCDETLSSWEADAQIHALSAGRKHAQDHHAAAIILQRFLEQFHERNKTYN